MRIGKSAGRGMALAAAMAACAVQAQLKWDGCADLSASQLRKTVLVGRNGNNATSGTTAVDASLNEPVKISVAGNGDVFIAERGGALKRWREGAMAVVGRLSVFTGTQLPHATQKSNEWGLHGVALDPGFEANHWIYLDYAPQSANVIRISRFEIKGDALDMGSEKKLLEIPTQRNSCCHTGGGMEFDAKGNLYITVGNNTTNPGLNAPDAYVKESDPDADDQGHAANTNDLRGKILRIHPKPDGTYDVPDGNLFPKGTEKTRPEIWAMGMRNPYSLSLDKVRGWVGWGDVGPDDNLSYSEEWNMLTRPGNGGWPYFVGANQAWRPALGKSASAPVNNSPNNTGLKTLPPAIPATIGYAQSCAVSGPVFYYDGSNPSKTMLPPHLDGKWLVTDWWKGTLEVVSLSADGSSVASRAALMPQFTFNGPLDLKVGPDGALYVVEYGQTSGGLWFSAAGNTMISRLEYTGSCHPPTPVPTALSPRPALDRGAEIRVVNAGLDWNRELDLPAWAGRLEIHDIRGVLVWAYAATGPERGKVEVPGNIRANGILRVRYLR